MLANCDNYQHLNYLKNKKLFFTDKNAINISKFITQSKLLYSFRFMDEEKWKNLKFSD